MTGASLIIPHWNRADMLKESLMRLWERTNYKPREIIVVDDGSEAEHVAKVKTFAHLYDKLVELPHKVYPRLTDASYLAGLAASNLAYPYVFCGADDLIYRTGWIQVLIEMLESAWAKTHNVGIVSGFNHWCLPNDAECMAKVIAEPYKSADGKVDGYCTVWGGNYFMRKDFFESIGGFENNLKSGRQGTYEAVLQFKSVENGWRWAVTRDTYVQTMARPDSSLLGNYRLDDKGNQITNEQYSNGVAVGVNWKDI